MAEFEQKPGTGAIFRNTDKTKDTQPDYRGAIITPDGEKLHLAFWVRTSQAGIKYFSVSVQKPQGMPARAEAVQGTEDDLPF